MATPNPDSIKNTATQQKTIAAFSRYIKAMEADESPTTNAVSSLMGEPLPATQGTYEPTNEETPRSPSAITPTHDPGDLWSQPANQKNVDINALVQDMGYDVPAESINDPTTDVIVDRLQIIGDEFDRQLGQNRPSTWTEMWTIIANAFSSADGSILQQFSDTITNLKKELSLRMIVKIFYFGYRLLTTLRPVDYYSEQQMKILSVFVKFLLNELSDWIDQQGGWENILSDNNELDHRMHSYSTSDLPDHELPNPLEEDKTPTDEGVRPVFELSCETPPSVHKPLPTNKRPESMTMSIPERSRQRPTTLQLNISNSFPRQLSRESPATTPTRSRGSLSNIVSFGIGMSFGFALLTYFYSK